MATTINDVNTIQIRNAKNGDFDLNLSGGSGGESNLLTTVQLEEDPETHELTIKSFTLGESLSPVKCVINDESVELISSYGVFSPTTNQNFIVVPRWDESILIDRVSNSATIKPIQTGMFSDSTKQIQSGESTNININIKFMYGEGDEITNPDMSDSALFLSKWEPNGPYILVYQVEGEYVSILNYSSETITINEGDLVCYLNDYAFVL